MDETADSADGPEIAGRIVIEWPAATGAVLPSWGVLIIDADTGQPIVTATRAVIADVSDRIVAVLTLADGPDEQAKVCAYEVVEMRVRDAGQR